MSRDRVAADAYLRRRRAPAAASLLPRRLLIVMPSSSPSCPAAGAPRGAGMWRRAPRGAWHAGSSPAAPGLQRQAARLGALGCVLRLVPAWRACAPVPVCGGLILMLLLLNAAAAVLPPPLRSLLHAQHSPAALHMLAPTDVPCCTPCPLPQACPLYKFKAGVRHQYISVCLPGGYLPCCSGKRGFLALLPWEEWVLALKGDCLQPEMAQNYRSHLHSDVERRPLAAALQLLPWQHMPSRLPALAATAAAARRSPFCCLLRPLLLQTPAARGWPLTLWSPTSRTRCLWRTPRRATPPCSTPCPPPWWPARCAAFESRCCSCSCVGLLACAAAAPPACLPGALLAGCPLQLGARIIP